MSSSDAAIQSKYGTSGEAADVPHIVMNSKLLGFISRLVNINLTASTSLGIMIMPPEVRL